MIVFWNERGGDWQMHSTPRKEPFLTQQSTRRRTTSVTFNLKRNNGKWKWKVIENWKKVKVISNPPMEFRKVPHWDGHWTQMVERKTIESESNLNSTNKVQQLELHSDYILNARYNIVVQVRPWWCLVITRSERPGCAIYGSTWPPAYIQVLPLGTLNTLSNTLATRGG